jgi:hypothetical protein
LKKQIIKNKIIKLEKNYNISIDKVYLMQVKLPEDILSKEFLAILLIRKKFQII